MMNPQLTPAYLARRLAEMPDARRYWVAYSGGRDSHVLLALLQELRQQQPLEIAAFHINHGLQADAGVWAAHCVAVCQEYDIHIEVCNAKVELGPGISPEAAARDARYAAFSSVIDADDGLLLAHHQDDQAETLLLQLLRGAGIKGTAAMPAHSAFAAGWLGRPLLHVPREALADYATHHGLQWIEDPSNDDRGFDRNFLRHEVTPVLQRRWPAAAASLSRAASHHADAKRCLADLAALDLSARENCAENELPAALLSALSPARQRNLLRYWLVERCNLPAPNQRHLQRILTEVVTASADSQPYVSWPCAEVRRYRDRLYALTPSFLHDNALVLPWDLQSELELPSLATRLVCKTSATGGLSTGLVTQTRGSPAVTVRFRQGGELCRPAGRGHRHSLKKLFQEWGVPPWRRDRVPLVYVGNELAEVVGFCTCEPFQAQTERGIQIHSRPIAEGKQAMNGD